DLSNANINYSVCDRKRDYDLYNIFCDVFNDEIGDDLKKIELIEALLFLSMIPLHGESLNHQMAMLATGLEILSKITDKVLYEED
ncbi:TPA: capsular biosynthesis protein, partial [Enterococcus faecium]